MAIQDSKTAATPGASSMEIDALMAQLHQCESSLADLKQLVPSDRMTIVVFSGEMDKMLSALFLATGAATMGTEVTLFFTFWGLSALRKKAVYRRKNLWHRMLAWMLPCGVKQLKISHMHLGGIGPKLFNHLMKKQNVPNLTEMLAMAGELGVQMTACSTAMQIMGIGEDELIDGLQIGGVATYMENASESRVNLFI
jgi:peroxiredoxin family protein